MNYINTHRPHRALLVHEPAQTGEYHERIASAADAWRRLAERRSGLSPRAASRLAIESAILTVTRRCNDFVIPLALEGSERCQGALWHLVKQRVGFGTLLEVAEDGYLLRVLHREEHLGSIPRRHTGWAHPLVKFGAEIRLSRILGTCPKNGRLGAEVIVTRVGASIEKLRVLLADHRVTANGVSAVREPDVFEEPFRFWRDEDGNACTNVQRTSFRTDEFEWGYGGSGPAELSLCLLRELLPDAQAWLLQGAFKDRFLEPMDWEGGEIRREKVRQWIEEQLRDTHQLLVFSERDR